MQVYEDTHPKSKALVSELKRLTNYHRSNFEEMGIITDHDSYLAIDKVRMQNFASADGVEDRKSVV